MRVRSDRPTRDGRGWIHLFSPAEQPPPAQAKPPRAEPESERAGIDVRDRAYTDFLSALLLDEEHRADLRRRGLPLYEINRLGYRSTPGETFADNAARTVSALMDLRGVPGFYNDGDRWRAVRTPPGFFVPYRDEQGRIEAMQIRRHPYEGGDKYIWFSSRGRHLGSSSGSPLHFAKHELLRDAFEAVITEGALKADVVAHLTQSPVVAAAGVYNFPADFAQRLRKSYPLLRGVIIAFDRDYLEKPQVYEAIQRLIPLLGEAEFGVRIRTWSPPSKGYDDYLLSQLKAGGGRT